MRLAFAKAFGDQYWPNVEYIINKESGFDPYATNSSSGACGLFQALPCSKLLAVVGSLDNVSGQTQWGIEYIKGRYGTPAEAYNFWVANRWY